MKIYAFFEELRKTREVRNSDHFQFVITSKISLIIKVNYSPLEITNYALRDFVHNCLRVKGNNVEDNVLYLR